MKYVALDIDGWLGGSCARYLSKAEKAIWSDIIVLGGKGKGRFGFVELDKGMGYTRQQLLAFCQCFTDEDITIFDDCVHKCVNGVPDGDFTDAPRLVLHPNNVYEIINWDTYQHSSYPKGLTEIEAKALKRSQVKPRLPIEADIDRAYGVTQTVKDNMDIARRVVHEDDIQKHGSLQKAKAKRDKKAKEKADSETGEIKEGGK